MTNRMIYTFDAGSFLLYPIMKKAFKLTDKEVYKTIECGFEMLEKQLSLKSVLYKDLKGALIPNQDKKKDEFCLVIDTMQIEDSDYGRYVFNNLIPLLDKKSTYSILCGDYIDVLRDSEHSQTDLRFALNERIARCHASEYRYSGQYFLIYFNRLSSSQRLKIVEGLYQYPWFTGFICMTHRSWFKTYISSTLTPLCIKNADKIIAAHSSEYDDGDNVNMRGFPFEEYGYRFLSVNEDCFGAFLSYKIESHVPDKDDISFSLNALFPQFDSFEKLDLEILDKRWYEYLVNKDSGKGKLLEILGYNSENKEDFRREIFKQICANYIYNLEENEYGDLKFNVCIELPTIHGNLRRTTVALKYFPEREQISVITIT